VILGALNGIATEGWITVELDSYAGLPNEAAEIALNYLQTLEKKFCKK
jgi:hypothetical protein